MTPHIGIVACSAEGAALCYRTICAEGAALLGPHAHPEVSLHSLSLADYVDCLNRSDLRGVGDLMLTSAHKLAAAGADFLICPDNTIHQAFAHVEPRSPLPWLHIAEVVAQAAVQRGHRRLGITGTRWLVDSEVYPEKLGARGLQAVRPSEAERAVTLCNSGLMAVRASDLFVLLDQIGNNNAAGEYYLPDIIMLPGANSAVIETEAWEVAGVNSRAELAGVEAVWQDRRRAEAMREGVTLVAPQTVFFSYDTVLGRDVTVEPNVVFGPGVTIADNVVIHAFSHLEGATIASGADIGPYARLRPGADIGPKAKVGNFVEIKKARLDEGAKVNHLSYIGDASVGAAANIGAGTITCNYDGFFKYKTQIGAGAFIGSNSALVAPATIGDGAIVAAGSVVTKPVPADALCLVRPQQESKPGWAAAFRTRMRERKAKA